jgi:hypothetical protein
MPPGLARDRVLTAIQATRRKFAPLPAFGPSMPRLRLLLTTAVAAALLASPAALAQQPAGRGAAIAPVANVPYTGGSDLEFHRYTIDGKERTFSFTGSYAGGIRIIDVTDPERPTLASTYDCGVTQGDVQVFTRPDLGGRVFAAYTQDTGYGFRNSACKTDALAKGFPAGGTPFGTFIADVTDPYNPTTVSFVKFARGSHNQTVHPSGKYLYNSNSDTLGIQPAIELADITDLAAPQALPSLPLLVFPGLGSDSHDITFSADGKRAYVAALSHAEILDTSDPAAPKSIGKLVDPAINVWHQAEAIQITDPVLGKRNFMIVEDEVAGASPTGQCPNGGVHVYDVTGSLEQAPVKVGYWNIDDVGTTENGIGRCTAHVFQLHHDVGLMTIAYYNGGVRVVDLSGLVGVALGGRGVGMKQVGWYRFANSDTWAVKAPFADRKGFYLYGNDQKRGFDVYRWTPAAGASVDSGTWMSPEQQLAAQRTAKALGGEPQRGGVCLLLRA